MYARPVAMALPIPEFPPVTITVFPTIVFFFISIAGSKFTDLYPMYANYTYHKMFLITLEPTKHTPSVIKERIIT